MPPPQQGFLLEYIYGSRLARTELVSLPFYSVVHHFLSSGLIPHGVLYNHQIDQL